MSAPRVFSILLLIKFIIVQSAFAQLDTGKKVLVYQFDIQEEIAPSATRKTSKAFDEAMAMKADLILLNLNTYGGLVSDADSIRTRILNSSIPVYVLIENNAASAGALISIACNKIFMRRGATIGAASVVNQSGELAPDKYQSYMRSKMRATAENRGRNPEIAEGMVDGNIVVEGVNKKGQVITFTRSEAMKFGYCDGEAESPAEVLKQEGIEDYTIVKQKVSFLDKAIGFLINPAVNGILVFLILGGIYYELRTPGIGFPLLVSIMAALLYFAPLYLEGLAENWEILLFIIGLVLLALEIFVIPGFGVAGVSGIILVFASFILAALRNINFDFSLTGTEALNIALLKVLLALIAFFLTAFIFGGSLINSRIFDKISLTASLEGRAELNPRPDNDTLTWIGMTGSAFTDLRPYGKILLGGRHLEASARSGFIPSGTPVKVIEQHGNSLIVVETESESVIS